MSVGLKRSIFHLAEEQRFPRNRFPGITASASLEQAHDRFRSPFPSPDFNQGADYGPDHVPEEPVGGNLEVQVAAFFCRISHQFYVVRNVCGPSGGIHRAYRCPDVASCLLEAGKVVGADQCGSRFVHSVKVQRIWTETGVSVHERVLRTVDEISIFPQSCVESGVEIFPGGEHLMYSYG